MSRNPYATTYSSDFGNPNRSRTNRVSSNQPGIARHVDNRRPGAPPVADNRNKPSRERIPTSGRAEPVRELSRRVEDFLDLDQDNEEFDQTAENEDLEVINVDVQAMENATKHRTDQFDAVENYGALVVRRGDPFDLVIQFNKKVNFKRDNLKFVFETGKNPTNAQWTRVECLLGVNEDSLGWNVKVKKRLPDNQLLVTVFTSSECIVSYWRMKIQTLMTIDGRTKSVSVSDNVHLYILFNPWNPDDAVYFPNTEDLHEYVLNDSGVIFQGTAKQIGSQPWFFGQFEDGILDAAIYCMQKGLNGQFDKPMGDPVRVSRAVSKIINSQDDNGVMAGRWDGNYSGGKHPMDWIGSVNILRQYMTSKTPVKYGQCWVFSGVVTTVCRALGLPCRSITNFNSAHDTDGNVVIDHIIDKDTGEPSPKSRDSVWNYHCWNEVWMQRRDLGAKDVSGWQVIDATPQEESFGKHQCGPTSVKALKAGITDLLFDGYFVYAEVNGDEVLWLDHKDGKRAVLDVITDSIGKKISTKDPKVNTGLSDASLCRMDITHEYKSPEGSEQERNAALKAARFGHKRKTWENQGRICDVKFNGFDMKDYQYIGSDIQVGGVMENTGSNSRNVEAFISCFAVAYNGKNLGKIKDQKFAGFLNPGQKTRISMDVKVNDYKTKEDEQAMMKLYVFVKCIETGQMSHYEDVFRLRRPLLTIEQYPKSATKDKAFECTVAFKNPLPDLLRNCYVTVEGPVHEAGKTMSVRDIAAGEYWKAIMNLTPKRVGKKLEILITLNSDKLKNIANEVVVDVFKR